MTQEVQAPGDGILLEIIVPQGEIAQVDNPVCSVDLALSRSQT